MLTSLEPCAVWLSYTARDDQVLATMTEMEKKVDDMMKATEEAKEEAELFEAERHTSKQELGNSPLAELITRKIRRETCPSNGSGC